MKAYRQWETEVGQILEGLMAVLNRCQRTCNTECASALLADADQMLAVSRHVETWVSFHPCPYPDIDTQLARLARSYSLLGASMDLLAHEASRIDWPVIDGELHLLHQSMARMVTMMHEQSMRQE
jgi:hypothetical protein